MRFFMSTLLSTRKELLLNDIICDYKDIRDKSFEDALDALDVRESLLVHQYDYLVANLKKIHPDVEKLPMFKTAVNNSI